MFLARQRSPCAGQRRSHRVPRFIGHPTTTGLESWSLARLLTPDVVRTKSRQAERCGGNLGDATMRHDNSTSGRGALRILSVSLNLSATVTCDTALDLNKAKVNNKTGVGAVSELFISPRQALVGHLAKLDSGGRAVRPLAQARYHCHSPQSIQGRSHAANQGRPVIWVHEPPLFIRTLAWFEVNILPLTMSVSLVHVAAMQPAGRTCGNLPKSAKSGRGIIPWRHDAITMPPLLPAGADAAAVSNPFDTSGQKQPKSCSGVGMAS